MKEYKPIFDADKKYKILEKGYREGVYGQIITEVETLENGKQKRIETFIPIGTHDESDKKDNDIPQVGDV